MGGSRQPALRRDDLRRSLLELGAHLQPGAAFSFLADQPGWQRWFFAALAIGVSAWIALMLRRHAGERLLATALALIMGGAWAMSSTASA